MQISRAKHLEDLGKTKNEDSRNLGRHYKGRNYVLMSQDILYGRKHPKDEKTCDYAQDEGKHYELQGMSLSSLSL
jgi:hypothetical protein